MAHLTNKLIGTKIYIVEKSDETYSQYPRHIAYIEWALEVQRTSWTLPERLMYVQFASCIQWERVSSILLILRKQMCNIVQCTNINDVSR